MLEVSDLSIQKPSEVAAQADNTSQEVSQTQ